MNPHILNLHLEAFNDSRKRLDVDMWTMGLYITHGISTIGKGKYPDKPFSQNSNFSSGSENAVLTEEEKQRQIEMLFTSLEVIGTNANLANKRKKKEQSDGSAD